VSDFEKGVGVFTVIQGPGRWTSDNPDHGNRGAGRDSCRIEKHFSESQKSPFGTGSFCCRESASFSRKLENLNFGLFLRPFGFDDETTDHDHPPDIITRGWAKIGKGNRGIDLSFQFRGYIDVAPASLNLMGWFRAWRQNQKSTEKKNIDDHPRHRSFPLLAGFSLIQPNEPDRPNKPNEQDKLADFFSILLKMIGEADQHILCSVVPFKSSPSNKSIIEP
jgi:hypothetical protein